MKEEFPACGRHEDLIAFLYDELDPVEKTSFRSHVQECLSCSAEVSEFGDIRESVVTWRNEALSGVTLPLIQPAPILSIELGKRSALAALREFFNLSPLWLKGAVVFGSILFCLFAFLAAARLRETPRPQVAENPNAKSYSDNELNALVAQRVKDELQRIKDVPAPAPLTVRPSEDIAHKKVINRRNEFASLDPKQRARRPLSRDERQQLAADLRLIEDPTDSQLELLDDRINQ